MFARPPRSSAAIGRMEDLQGVKAFCRGFRWTRPSLRSVNTAYGIPTSHCAYLHISVDGVKSTPYLATIEFFTVRLWQRRGRDTARLWTGQLLAQRQVLEAEVSLPAEETREKPKEVKERG